MKPSTASAAVDGAEKAVDKPPCAVYHVFIMSEGRYTAAQRNKTIILLRASTFTEARRRSCRGRSGQRSGWQGKHLCFLIFPLRTQQNKNFVAFEVGLCYNEAETKLPSTSARRFGYLAASGILCPIYSMRTAHCNGSSQIRPFPEHAGCVCFYICKFRLQFQCVKCVIQRQFSAWVPYPRFLT